MGVWGYLPVLLGILIIGTISSNEAFAAPVIIDDFQTDSGLLFVDNSFTTDSNSVSGPGIIPPPSGFRDINLFWASGIGGGAFYETSSGSGLYHEDPNIDALLELDWDNDAAGFNEDLTDGGANDQFELRISSTTAFDLLIEVEDSTFANDNVGLSQSALPGLTVISIPFSSFSGVDFTDITSILLVLDLDTNTNNDIEIDFFQTSGQAPVGSHSIPIDSTPMLVAGSEMNSIWITLSIIAAVGVSAVIVTKRFKN